MRRTMDSREIDLRRRHARAVEEMALVTELLAGLPHPDHRGATFWLALASRIVERHGLTSLALPEGMVPCRIPDPAPDPVPDTPAPSPPKASAGILSESQVQTLALTARGLTVGQISRLRVESQTTTKARLAKVYGLLGAVNAAHAVAIASHHGLLPPPDDADVESTDDVA